MSKNPACFLIASLLFCGCQAGASEDSSKAVNQNQKFKIIGRKRLQPESQSFLLLKTDFLMPARRGVMTV